MGKLTFLVCARLCSTSLVTLSMPIMPIYFLFGFAVCYLLFAICSLLFAMENTSHCIRTIHCIQCCDFYTASLPSLLTLAGTSSAPPYDSCYLLFAVCYLLFAICYLLFAICYCYFLLAILLLIGQN